MTNLRKSSGGLPQRAAAVAARGALTRGVYRKSVHALWSNDAGEVTTVT